MKWENRKKKWKINHEYRRVLTLGKIMEEILQEWKGKDMVSVVRCKDCVHMEMMDKTLNDVRYVFCNKSKQHRFMPSDGYCSYGERREP